jgi:hypothetical protein
MFTIFINQQNLQPFFLHFQSILESFQDSYSYLHSHQILQIDYLIFIAIESLNCKLIPL